jgi:hypothetical protein
MKTFVTISAGVLLALSCVATSDARLHANREGQTQSEPSNYNPDYYNPDYNSQTNTRNWDNSCLHCGATTGLAQTLFSYESNGFPITLLQASPHQVAVLGAPIQMAQKPLPSYESTGFHITPLELVLFGPNDVKERSPLIVGGMGG